MAENAIEVRNLAVSLEGKKILRDANVVLEKGCCLALLGPSGSGKTTLLRAIAGFVLPEAGTIKIFGSDMEGVLPERRPVSMLFQEPPLFDEKTVEENALFGLLRRGDQQKARQRVEQLAEVFDLEEFLRQRVKPLSGGERQRAAFIRAFANAKKIMLLDEPIHSAFDLHQRRVLMGAIKECAHKADISTVVVTHDLDEAAHFADKVLVLVNGESSSNTLREMYESPISLNVARILGYGNEVEADVLLDGNRLAQECPLRIFGTLRKHGNPAWAFFRPENVEVIRDGAALGFTVESVVFSGASNRLVLRAQHGNRSIEAVVPADKEYSCGDVVAVSVQANRIMFFTRDGNKVGD